MTPPPTEHDCASVELHDDRGEIEAIEDQILTAVDRHDFPKSSRFAIKLALEEAITNAFQHGHKTVPKGTPITVEFDVNDDRVSLAVIDRGPGFAPSDVPDPTLDENLANPTGRGIMLMRAYMTEVSHKDSGRRVELVYRRPVD
ncbi:MAG: ATP-binding protein [Planctomycetota bacterium]